MEGLRALAWAACAGRAQIWSITDASVMHATIRIAPWQAGHARGSTRRSAGASPPTGGWPRWTRVVARDDGRGSSGGGGLRLRPHPAGAFGTRALVPSGHVARVGHVHQDPGEYLRRVHGLGARRRPPTCPPVRHRLCGPVVRQPFERHGIPRALSGGSRSKGPVLLGHRAGRVHVEPGSAATSASPRPAPRSLQGRLRGNRSLKKVFW